MPGSGRKERAAAPAKPGGKRAEGGTIKRPALLLVVLAFAVAALAGSVAFAHCSPNDLGENAHDPFRSCESVTGNGHTNCGSGTEIPDVGAVSMPSSGTGIQVCVEDSSPGPYAGRVGIYRDAAGNVTIFFDGDDATNLGPTGGWVRVDIRQAPPCRFQVRQGDAGSYWTQGGGTSPTDLNQCVG